MKTKVERLAFALPEERVIYGMVAYSKYSDVVTRQWLSEKLSTVTDAEINERVDRLIERQLLDEKDGVLDLHPF